MKYWVYKDSRILGPFDKDAVAGLPGVDSSTLVSAGESAAAGEGDWRPAGEVSEFSSLPLDRGSAWPTDDLGSTYGLLDKLEIESAGLFADDEYPSAAGDLFQDAEMKRAFGDLIAPRPNTDDAELRRAKDQAAQLTAQLEMLYQRVSELEAGQTNLLHRLAEKEMLLRRQPTPAAAPDVESFLRETAAPATPSTIPSIPPSADPAATVPPATPPAAGPPSDWPSVVPGGDFPSFPSRTGGPSAPPIRFSPPAPVPPAPASTAPVPPPPAPPASAAANPPAPPAPEAFAPSAPFLPAAPAGSAFPPPVPLPGAPEAAAPADSAAPAPKKAVFERKSFKIVPTVKAFRVVGAEDIPVAGSAATPGAAPELSPEQTLPSASAPAPLPALAPAASAPEPAAAPAPAFDWSAPAAAAPAPVPEPIALQPVERPAPAPAFAQDSTPTPAPAPPATLSFGGMAQPAPARAPMPSFSGPAGDFAGGDAATAAVPAFGGPAGAPAPSTQEVLARLAKPAPAPATAAPRPPRSNKVFLIAAGGLVVVMGVIGFVFLRNRKDLKQMTDLDDGRARLGAEPVDDASRPPMIKPRPFAPAEPNAAPNAAPNAVPNAMPNSPAATAPPAAAGASGGEAAQAASQANLDAAVAMVKDFPLDGERGTVAQLLQFSYTASPDAGKESWSASETADKTYLVEYRFTPAHGGPDAHYLFEADMDRGFVIGKNVDAKNMLAGGPRGEAEKPKAKAKAKRKKKAAGRPKARAPRPDADTQPKDVPLLPLPNEGELRPPAEDDGAFGSDTVNSGL